MTTAGLASPADGDVWRYAREHGFAAVSKDSDFRQLAFLHGPPPKMIWLRIGNASTATVLQLILDHVGSGPGTGHRPADRCAGGPGRLKTVCSGRWLILTLAGRDLARAGP